MSTFLVLFTAGLLTILLPCILPLVPIVVGATVAEQRRARPLAIAAGMVVSFVASTFLFQSLLQPFVRASELTRTAGEYILVLFGITFLVERSWLRLALAVAGAVPLFARTGWLPWLVASVAGPVAMLMGGRTATRLQQLGSDVGRNTRSWLARDSLLAAFIVGLTLGLVWSPCAGPALGFALTLVRDEHGGRALLLLSAYALGAALPLVAIGYGGQRLLGRLRWLVRRGSLIKYGAGLAMIATAFALHAQALVSVQTWVDEHTAIGRWAGQLEQALWKNAAAAPMPAPTTHTSPASDLPTLPKLGPAPELVGLGPWYNSPPLSLASLRGKVVLVDFWTYSCINCIRTLPSMRATWSRYHDKPFVVIGVHAPEFAFEKNPANVAAAVKRYDLSYPIAQDNDFATWKAFGNQYWPAKYLIDAQGILRYTHFGEGGDAATDAAIRSLLAEAGRVTAAPDPARSSALPAKPISPETYVGERGWLAFANRQGPPDDNVHRYAVPDPLTVDHFALGGEWQLADGERQILRSERGEIRLHALAGEVNLVLGVESGPPASADVVVDGQPTTRFQVDRHDLYNLFRGPYGEHDIVVRLHGKNVAAYAFTFGG